ncbi:FHA domain-containing protein [Undibacterium sp. LX40W]|uniref:FHA domain-containing protein n=1 Tax=Undibacterium nitidum TaxID=2762298 RepID=A0A923HLU4_9BURK|nr:MULTISPECIES: FHA domain-containing protein [Undibacterium]MBC3882010.1 FHA domain-containing protein [Undibacterium nitidum]MBC3891994.1 FHA domain-containing protein [Undibacterium sp. LX40W]
MHIPPILPSPSLLASTSYDQHPAAAAAVSRLRLSAYDPRAVGGRQTVRLSLPSDFAVGLDNLELRVRCDLLPMKTSQYRFVRSLSGEWQSVLLSFSSRNKEHGQYPLEMELRFHHEQACVKRWLCSTVLLLPRSDASLSEIHQVFLASQKNVRVIAEDGAIARLQQGQLDSGRHRQLNVEVIARDASLAQVAMPSDADQGHSETAPGYLAWDEVLVEVAAEAMTQEQALQREYQQKSVATSANITAPAISTEERWCAFYHPVRHHWLRILEGETWRIGRAVEKETQALTRNADIQIAHPRISAMHATLQRQEGGVELIDSSRYGVLLNGERLAPLRPVRLQIGDRIDLCASFAGTLVWQVITLNQNMLVLQHSSEHGAFETLCLIFRAANEKSCAIANVYQGLAQMQEQTQARGIPNFGAENATTNLDSWKRFEQSYPPQI